jgi:hypothetical protein
MDNFYKDLYKVSHLNKIKNLKIELDITIEFCLKEKVVDDIKSNIDSVLITGLDHFMKIGSYLEMIIVNEENQSNKMTYEECLGNCVSSTGLINALTDLSKSVMNNRLDRLVDYSRIKKDTPELADEFKSYMDKLIQDAEQNKILIFNHYINQYLSILVKIKELLKKI